MGNKVGKFLLELVGWNDAQRIVSEYDPVTGEKLSFGDRLLAGGFLALSLLPPVKAVGIGGKTVIKGVDAGIPALAKTPGVLKKIRNVLDPKKFQQVFCSVYDQVVNAPIGLTKDWFDTIKKEIGEIRLTQITQEVYAGIGAAERTVKDAFTDAKDLIQQIKHTKLDELDVGEAGGATKGTSKGINLDINKGVNFAKSAADHMDETCRFVPVNLLREAIKSTKGVPDPRGSNALMHYTTLYRNGKKYNLEVLYDKKTNTIYHFEYAKKAMGPLPAIPKK